MIMIGASGLTQITFANQWTISFGIGNSHYSSRRDLGGPYFLLKKEESINSKNCEVAVLNPEGKQVYFWADEMNAYKGWVSPEELLEIMNQVQALDTNAYYPTSREIAE